MTFTRHTYSLSLSLSNTYSSLQKQRTAVRCQLSYSPDTRSQRRRGVTGGEVRYGSIGGLEYEVPQSRLYCLCINVDLCSTALQCICRVIRRNSMTTKAHTYYIIFGRPPIGGSFPPFPLAAPLFISCSLSASTSPLITRTRRPAIQRYWCVRRITV